MKILLLGEYSRLHNTLKEGLLALNHEVLLVGTGDNFKNYPVDINVCSPYRNKLILKYLYSLLYKVTGYNFFQKSVYKQLLKHVSKFKNYDVVQLINEDAFLIKPSDQISFLKQIVIQNELVYLSACGEDSHVIDYYINKGMRYSILDPFIKNTSLKKEAYFSYKYLTPEYQKLHQFTINSVNGIIPSDLDYAIPYTNVAKVKPMIPNPINVDKIKYKELIINDKINIFFGVNSLSYYKKGADIVLQVLKKVGEEYGDKIQITIAENLPYNEYLKKYETSHIFIDQLYSYDQGYNALEAMAKGKCVLTGAESEFIEYYKLDKQVAVNVLPDFDDLFKKIVALIQDKEQIIKIGKEARSFIEKEHHYITIAQKYINTWKNS